MPLSAADRSCVSAFRNEFERWVASREGFEPVVRDDRDDDSSLSSRFAVLERVWLELTIRPFIPQVRVGIVTDDRWKNEDFEERIEESGDTMSEFVEMGFEEAGLAWRAPLVEHFREHGKFFCFATALELTALTELANPSIREKIQRMFDGYHQAFRPAIERMKSGAQQA